MTAEIIGLGGLATLFGLLMLRAPIGVAMVIVGMGGVFALGLVHSHAPFLPYLKQYKTLLWNTVSNYELSVVPLFVLMGYLSANIDLAVIYSPAYTPLSAVGGGASAWRRWALAPVLARYAALPCDGFGDGAHCTAGIAASALSTGLCRRYFGGGRHIGYSHSAIRGAGDIRHHRGSVHHQDISSRHRAGCFGGVIFLCRYRRCCSHLSRRCRPNAAAVRRRKKTRHPARHTRFVNFWNRYFWFEHGGFHPHTGGGNRRCAVLLYGLIAKTANGRRFNIIAFRHRQTAA